MSFETAFNAIQARFKTLATAAGFLSTQLSYPNVPFDTPQGLKWLRLSVVNGMSDLAALGGGSQKMYRNVGVIIIQVFHPVGEGEQKIAATCDVVSSWWRGASFSGIICNAPYVQNVGAANGWYQKNVVIPIYWDDII
jgi:hypothetical protein